MSYCLTRSELPDYHRHDDDITTMTTTTTTLLIVVVAEKKTTLSVELVIYHLDEQDQLFRVRLSHRSHSKQSHIFCELLNITTDILWDKAIFIKFLSLNSFSRDIRPV